MKKLKAGRPEHFQIKGAHMRTYRTLDDIKKKNGKTQ